MEKWRLIPLLSASGAEQMAIDRWLIQQHRQGKQPSTLRFYTWSPPAISLGYHQRRYPNHWHHLRWQQKPIELVRRPTGGRAVLHQGDLTYCVVTSGIKGNITVVYETICQFLIEGWRSLGINLDYGQKGRNYSHQANCFATTTNADLIDDQGNKRIGSAQLRQGKAILQHGSMLLCPDPNLFKQVFGVSPSSPVSDSSSHFQDNLIQSLIEAASQSFCAQLIPKPLSAPEWQEIKALMPLSQV